MTSASITVEEKAQEAHAAFERAWKGKPISFEKGDTRLELREKPSLKMKGDLVVGVSYYDVHLFDAQGKEIPIDPTRHIVNHPQYPRSSISYVDEIDPESGLTISRRVLGNANVLEAGWEAVSDSIIAAPNPKRFGTKGTVTTVFATAPGGSGSGRGASSTYATARSTFFAAVADHRIGQFENGVGTFECYEAAVIFDLSGIADDQSASVVTLSMDGAADASTANEFDVVAASSSYNGGVFGSGDWIAGASLTGQTTYASWNTAGYDAGYNAFTSVAAFLTAVNATGFTSSLALMLYGSRHAAGNQPGAGTSEYVVFTDADAAGTTTDPKLDITHDTVVFNGPYPRGLFIPQSVNRAAVH